jgi:hypothetical protein
MKLREDKVVDIGLADTVTSILMVCAAAMIALGLLYSILRETRMPSSPALSPVRRDGSRT